MSPKRDLDTAASRFTSYIRRIHAGLELQQQRVLNRSDAAPRLPGLPDHDIAVLLGPDNDLDYYIYELGRLHHVGRAVLKVFGNPPTLVVAAAAFKSAIPHFTDTRNALTHPSDNDWLDNYATFSSAVKLLPGGGVEQLVDPRYEQHDAAIAYATEIHTFLRRHIRDSIARTPTDP